jgi:hypothetical protein
LVAHKQFKKNRKNMNVEAISTAVFRMK